MIPSKQLRIGNWVILRKRMEQVESWMFIQECKNMTPITITQKILEDCGFKKMDNEVNGYDEYDCGIKYYWFKVFLNKDNHCCVHYLQVAIYNHPQYLHELQNLILSLTGIELEYSPK